MTVLEARYRRLIGLFPGAFRSAYEQEMLGVLMAGAKPGQRFPAPGEVVDLMRAGVRARLTRRPGATGDAAWRDAATVTGLLTAVFLAAVAARRLALGLHAGVTGVFLLDVSLRTVAWVVVVAAVVAGRRRTAAGLALGAAFVEAAAAVAYWDASPLSWNLVAVVLATGFLALGSRGRPVREVLGDTGTAVVGGAAVVATVLGLPTGLVPWWLTAGIALDRDAHWVLPAPGLIVAGLVLLAGLHAAAPPVRHRSLALAAAPVVILLAKGTLWSGLVGPAQAGLLATQIALMLIGPPATVGIAAVLLRWREAG